MRTWLFAHPGAELFGSDRMLVESVAAARERGYRCVVALPERGPLVDVLQDLGAHVVVTPTLVLRKSLLRPRGWPLLVHDAIAGAGAAWRLLSRVRPDAVYVNTITVPVWPLVARARGVPSLSHVHEAEASGSRLINRILYTPHLLSRRVVVNSRFARETIRRSLPTLAVRAHVIDNGVAAPAEPAPARTALRGPMRVLFVGRLSPRKGPDVLLEATRLLRAAGADVRVGLLGTAFAGYEPFESRLRRTAAELDADVEFYGFREEIWPYLADADVLVVPSTVDEPFGNTAVEGVLAERPVIASDTSGLREAAGGYPTAWLVPAGDAAALAAAIERVRETWESVLPRLATSRRLALAKHAPSVYRKRVADHLASVVDSSIAGSSTASVSGR